jgi:predicted metal-binding protein
VSKHLPAAGIRAAMTPWQDVVLVCRKCSRKLDGGFGKDRESSLRTELKQALRASGRRRKLRVMETGCFSVCPKHAVSVMQGSRPGEILVVPEGTDAAELLRRLDPLLSDDRPS